MLHAVVYAKDPLGLATFYGAVLGEDLDADPGGRFATVAPKDGDYELHLVAVADDLVDQILIASPPVPRTETPIKLVLDVGDLDAARGRVGIAGGTLAPQAEAWTWR
ncbi:MAG: hypothetical protein HKN46_00960, partial [Acidimicrobiia bacterium]|nr:hypothetical protein [Acidimicrobiia bacterium]